MAGTRKSLLQRRRALVEDKFVTFGPMKGRLHGCGLAAFFDIWDSRAILSSAFLTLGPAAIPGGDFLEGRINFEEFTRTQRGPQELRIGQTELV